MADFYATYPPKTSLFSINGITGSPSLAVSNGLVLTVGASTLTVSGPTITLIAFGTTTTVPNSGNINYVVTTSTGATTINLPTGTNAAIGTVVIVSDLDAIAAANHITIDAGASNTINAATNAQTFVMATNGQSISLQKVTATAWKLK